MSTFQQENAITYRIDKMRKLWSKQVNPCTQLVKWLVKRDEARMVHAFCLLEGSEQGKLPEFFLNFECRFSSKAQYGSDLLNNWLSKWNSSEARKEVGAAALPDWDDSPFKNEDNANSIKLLLDCLSSFVTAVGKEEKLALYVMPLAYDGNPEFREWVFECLENLPQNLVLIIYDLSEYPVFKDIPPDVKKVTIEPDLKMYQAAREIINASSGSANPALDLNKCLLNMADGLTSKSEKEVRFWGEKAVSIGKDLKRKSLEATAYLAYGSAFFQLKKYDDALELYQKAEAASVAGLGEQDPIVPTLLLQSYNFIAAVYFLKGKRKEAFEYYSKTAEEAFKQKNLLLHLEAGRIAAELVDKQGLKQQAYQRLKTVWQNGLSLEKETQKYSSMQLVCKQLYLYAEYFGEKEKMKEVKEHAEAVWGKKWRD